MSEANKQHPFKTLGGQLKRLREKRQESLAEVSGAVEIDPDVLQAFEQGNERPAEDILLLLISHFATKDEVASKLWELAGYDREELPMQYDGNTANEDLKNGTATMAQNTPIVYTDMVHVMVNNYGVVMNFMQTAGNGNQPVAISRIGMSREHAQSVLEILQKTLSLSDPKSLPSSKDKKDKN
jgi:transcriptional regulator with XRE-family HTH domain